MNEGGKKGPNRPKMTVLLFTISTCLLLTSEHGQVLILSQLDIPTGRGRGTIVKDLVRQQRRIVNDNRNRGRVSM